MSAGPTLRTCWECNSAHEHLKSCPSLTCINCGTYYENGVAVGKGDSLIDAILATPDGKRLLEAMQSIPSQPFEGQPLTIESLEVKMRVVEYKKET